MTSLARPWLGVWAVGFSLAAGCGDGHTAVTGTDAATGSAQLFLATDYGETDGFSPVPTNGTDYRTCTLSNVGTLPTMLDSVSIQGSPDFALQSNCQTGPDFPFAVGATCTMTIAFSPSAETYETASLVVTASDGEMKTATFTGTGTVPLSITEYPTPTANSAPWTMAAGADGALWFAENGAHQVGRVTTAGAFTEYPVPYANAWLESVVAGPDGALWFADSDNNQVVRVAVDGTFTAYLTPTLNQPEGITVGPDGAFWVTAYGGTVGRLTTDGTVTATFAIPTLNAGAGSITSDGNEFLYFTEYDAGNIARMDTSGDIFEFPTRPPQQNPVAITESGGSLWFILDSFYGVTNEQGPEGLAAAPNAGGAGTVIATGPDGELWFSEPAGNRIARLSTGGDVTEFPLPTANATPSGLAVGPDRAIWFTEAGASQIGRIVPVLPN